MKSPSLSWQEYLETGVEYMEGATLDGKRRPRKAEAIFWDCLCAEPLDTNIPQGVKAEAFCRLAQLWSYQGCGETALKAARDAHCELVKGQMDNTSRAQCLVILGTIEGKYGSLDQSRLDLDEASRLAQPGDHKLCADISNALAKQYFQSASRFSSRDEFFAQAIFMIEEAISAIRKAPLTPLRIHAEVAMYIRAGMFYARGENKSKAEAWIKTAQWLFDQGDVKDSGLRAALWEAKMFLAELENKQVRATICFLRHCLSAVRCRWQLTTFM
jgi:hypothetical protein